MRAVVENWSDEDLKAVAVYIGALRASLNSRPAEFIDAGECRVTRATA
jgi:cytochrome c553